MAQGVNVIKAEVVLQGLLGVLKRKLVLGELVTKTPSGQQFVGAKNDTVTIAIPSYTNARTRQMRSNTALVIDDLEESSVDVKLTTHVYKGVGITDEQMTLDIVNFGAQVIQPATDAVARGIEDAVIAEMAAAPYVPQNSLELDADNPWRSLVSGRTALNKANVPPEDRFLAVGADVEEVLLNDDKFIKTDYISALATNGVNTALAGATIGSIAGLPVVSAPGLDPDWAIMAHRSAFVMALVAPVVPDGAPWGNVGNYAGYNLRVLRDYEPQATNGPRDRFLTDTFLGTATTKDRGVIDGQGRFQPDAEQSAKVVRAVKFVLEGQS